MSLFFFSIFSLKDFSEKDAVDEGRSNEHFHENLLVQHCTISLITRKRLQTGTILLPFGCH